MIHYTLSHRGVSLRHLSDAHLSVEYNAMHSCLTGFWLVDCPGIISVFISDRYVLAGRLLRCCLCIHIWQVVAGRDVHVFMSNMLQLVTCPFIHVWQMVINVSFRGIYSENLCYKMWGRYLSPFGLIMYDSLIDENIKKEKSYPWHFHTRGQVWME